MFFLLNQQTTGGQRQVRRDGTGRKFVTLVSDFVPWPFFKNVFPPGGNVGNIFCWKVGRICFFGFRVENDHLDLGCFLLMVVETFPPV